MKKCPFCAEDIQEDAIKCKHCGEFLNQPAKGKWYFRTSMILFAFLCVGPFALPLVWFHPTMSLNKKIVVTVMIGFVTYWLTIQTQHALQSLREYYKMIF